MALPRRPPPELNSDATSEILLRLPPDDPACLLRASLVCKPWLRLLSGPAFLRRYDAFHGAPPVLGVLGKSHKPSLRPHHILPATRICSARGELHPLHPPFFFGAKIRVADSVDE
ncbi:hypothetical protein ACP70R_015198 [Stipagrostis hirtigluma subsp. patula]